MRRPDRVLAVRSDSGEFLAYIAFGIRGLLFAVFAASVATKLRSRAAFAEFATAAGKLAPGGRRFVRVGSAVVAMSEVGILTALAMPDEEGIGFGLAMGVLVAFSALLAAAIAHRRTVRCRCFGADGSIVGVRHLVRNVVLISVGCVGLSVGATEPRRAGGAALALATGVIAGLVLTRWDDLAYLAVGDSAHATESRT